MTETERQAEERKRQEERDRTDRILADQKRRDEETQRIINTVLFWPQ